MNSHKSRRILSTEISFIITILLCVCAMIICLKATAFNQGSMINNMQSHKVAEDSQQQILNELTALSRKSGIPLEIFENVANVESIRNAQNDVTNSAFEGRVYDLNDSEIEKIFYNNFVEYCKNNSIEITNKLDSDLKKIASLSNEIFIKYADNTLVKSFAISTVTMNIYATKVLSVSLLIIMILTLLLCVLYDKKNIYRGVSYFSSSLISSGAVSIILALAMMIKGLKSFTQISPACYFNTFKGLYNNFFLLLLIFGFVMLTIGVGLYIYIYKTIIIKEERKRHHRSSRTYVKLFTNDDNDIDDKHLEQAPDKTE